uniref:Uncharacterized protein n=1 Tax=Human herpesvirus 1 TaxID=10298 RepID=A0A2Z4HCK2_HHV1|nr:hypothetical protein [Human alphaherpesvirus 1]
MHDPAPTPARRGPVAAARWSNPRPRPSAPSAMGGARGRVGPRPAPHGISLPPDPAVSASVPHANEERAGGGARAPTSRFGGNEIRAPRARWPSPGPRSRPPDAGTNGTAGGPRAARLAAPPHWPAGGTAPRGRGRRVKEVRTRSVRTSSQYIYIIRAKCEHWRRARLRAGPGGGPGRRGAGLSGAHKGPARPTPADGAGHERRERLRSTRTGSGSRRGPSERTASASRRPGSGSGSHRKGTRGRGGERPANPTHETQGTHPGGLRRQKPTGPPFLHG